MEKQLDCIKAIPPSSRILHIDATSELVTLTKRQLEVYVDIKMGAILNYFCVLKNMQKEKGQNGSTALIGEMVTSKQGTNEIECFLRTLRFNYSLCYPNDAFYFRLIVLDYSSALIHGVCGAINCETIITYAKRVYGLSIGAIDVKDESHSWLASCVAHTMKRYVNMINLLKLDPDLRSLAIYSFTLLLNSKTLNVISEYFKLICYIFLSEYNTESSKIAFKSIVIAQRTTTAVANNPPLIKSLFV
jgi:hypothetical protein